jgi:peptide-methionine (S)-S-oxide reductase
MMSTESNSGTEIATLGGGCFWCIEAVYERIDGVKAVVSGYAGGEKADPTYEEVCTGTTGHAEVVQIHFDPQVISYEEVLDLFWKAHDPTTLNRQGADVGTQYRSIILYSSEAQAQAAERSKVKAAAHFDDPIVTEIVPLSTFYEAEKYHQDYYENNPFAGYCTFVIRPKLQKLGLDS